MKKTITEVLDFMERLREAFPCDKGIDYFGDYVKCHVCDVSDKLDMPMNEVWEYVGSACDAHLIDNNGGDLKFNNSLFEDAAEMMLLDAFYKAEMQIGGIPVGFIYKVIHNMYRNDNFCAGKLADMHRMESVPVEDVILEMGKWVRNKEESEVTK